MSFFNVTTTVDAAVSPLADIVRNLNAVEKRLLEDMDSYHASIEYHESEIGRLQDRIQQAESEFLRAQRVRDRLTAINQ